jgi:hypothetical protein
MATGVQAASRTVTFAPGGAAALGGWEYLHRPLAVPGAHAALWHAAGLGVFLAAGLVIWPVLIVTLLYLVPKVPAGLVPRDWRKRYRKRLIEQGVPRSAQRSSYISARLKRVTFAADRHRCVACRVRLRYVDHMEWDHIGPWSLGYLTTLFNGMTLCPACNKTKSNYWRYRRSGRAVYVPFDGWVNEAKAAAILRLELRHRWNVLRWVRAAWALGT